MPVVNEISTLVGEKIKGDAFHGSVVAANRSIYGIPSAAGRIVKFHLVSKSVTYIGPDFGTGYKWSNGAITDSGIIYCVPYCTHRRGILKIDTNTDNVTELNANLLPEQGVDMWLSYAVAPDGCIYFMPRDARRIMKIDPNNMHAISSVGDDLGAVHGKYSGTVVGIDGCLYGIPSYSKCILKYDPINDITSFVGEKINHGFFCSGGALGRDGCIYAITCKNSILKIDTTNNSHYFVGNTVDSDHDRYHRGWGDAILGIDGCIYWPPQNARYILKYDPHTNRASLVGDDFGHKRNKWRVGSLASDGVIYCIPEYAEIILCINPWKEFTSSMQQNIEKQPDQLGYIFHPSSDDMSDESNFDRAVAKFGRKRVLKVLEDCLSPADRLIEVLNMYPFMLVASLKDSDISLIYQLMRKVPSLVSCFHSHSHASHNIL